MTIESVSPERGTAQIRVDHSVYPAEYGSNARRRVCYMFGSAYAGAMEYVAAAAGHELALAAEETACAAEGAQCCRFAVGPRGGGV